jgi:hypothetical protein
MNPSPVFCSLALAPLMVAGSATLSRAQPAATVAGHENTADPARGYRLTAAAGPGWIDTDGADRLSGKTVALTAEIRLSEHIGLVLDAAWLRQNDGRYESSRYAATQTLGLQVWPVATVWLRGALGLGLSEYRRIGHYETLLHRNRPLYGACD